MSYNNSVLVGNWSEERLKNEFEFKIFLRKRERHELLLQRSRTLFSNLLKERPLLISGANVLFGYNVQLVASDMLGNKTKVKAPDLKEHFPQKKVQARAKCYKMYLLESEWGRSTLVQKVQESGAGRATEIPTTLKRHVNNSATTFCTTKAKGPSGKPQYGLALSSLVSARQVDYMQNINDGCLMTMSPITTPCCRNTFVIVSTEDESLRGEKMIFGDEFFLKAENYGDPTAPPLYVRYTPAGAPSPANRMPLQLSSHKDTSCRFTTIPLLPCDRLEGQGSPVKTGTKLIVRNCVADLNLCVMNQQWMQTFFGPECGVTCRNCMDIHKRFTAENIFQLVSDIETKSMD